jgi:dienelactone hydrolase
MHSASHDYTDGTDTFEGYFAWDTDHAGPPRPAVIVAHQWAGQGDHEREVARHLAKLGYVGFALDMYGKGKRGTTTEENSALMQPFMQDRALVARRMALAVAEVRRSPAVDGARVAAIGFCFGGLCCLDLARSGADVRGVVAIHGLLFPSGLPEQRITASVLALHGYADPMAKPEHLLAFADEMTRSEADWQALAFGHARHAFTTPGAANEAMGLVFHQRTRDRAFAAMERFLAEVLA